MRVQSSAEGPRFFGIRPAIRCFRVIISLSPACVLAARPLRRAYLKTKSPEGKSSRAREH